MQRKISLPNFILIICLALSFLPFNASIVRGDQLRGDQLHANEVANEKGSASSPSLSGEAAIEYLQHGGEYESLHTAFQQAQNGVNNVSAINAYSPLHFDTYVKASNTDTYDQFGGSIAIDGNTVVIGSCYESSNASGINGNQEDNSMSGSGAAYVFVRSRGQWIQQAYLKASNPDVWDHFGCGVDISGDTIIVSAPLEDSNASGVNGDQSDNSDDDKGAIYVFVRNGTTWSQQAYLKGSNSNVDGSGGQGAISGDIIIVQPYVRDTLSYAYTGSANVFVRSGTEWSLETILTKPAPESTLYFGAGMSFDGNTLVLHDGSSTIYIYIRTGNLWSLQATITDLPYWTGRYRLSGDTLGVVTGYNPFQFRIYVRNGTSWSRQADFVMENSGYFALDGNTLLFGGEVGFNGNLVYVYKRQGVSWIPTQTLFAPNHRVRDSFGMSFAIDGDTIVVGGPEESSNATGINGNQNDNSAPGAGAAFIFTDTPQPTPTCAGLSQEAESSNAILTGFTIADDAAASGGKYIGAPNGGNYFISPNIFYKAEYCFNVPTAGLYRIKANVHAADTTSDSFYVQVDGAPTGSYLWDVFRNTTYASDYVNDRNGADPVEVLLGAGPHYVTVYLRKQGTRLDTIALEQATATPPVNCSGLLREAESGLLSGNWAISNDSSASGGAYIAAPNGSGDFWNGASGSQKASYCFNIDTAGTYRLRGKVYGADTLSDSFYVNIDGSPTSGYLWDVYRNINYVNDFVNDRGVADPVEVQLSAGQHIVNLFVREDGTRLDTIELQLANSAPPPSPTCAGLNQEAETGALRGNFTISSDSAASNGQYIGTPSGSGDFWNGPNVNHKAEYCFNVASAGNYRIDGKVYGADSLSDSFYVQVDGAPANGYLWDVLPNTSYQLDSVSNRNSADPVVVALSSGPHTVTVYARESGTRLDTIQLLQTTAAPQSRAIPPLAKGIGGTVRINIGTMESEIDFSTFTVTLIDAETQGQSFSQQVQPDRFGNYHFDGMTPGNYIVQLQTPSGLAASTNSATIEATRDEPVTVDFEVSGGVTSSKTYLPLISR